MEIALAVLLVLSFPIIAIAGLVIAIGARDRVRVLEQRFADFQRPQPASAAPSAAPPQRPEAPPSVVSQPAAPEPPRPAEPPARAIPDATPPRTAAASVPPSRPPSPPSAPQPIEPAMGFEERLGTQW